MDIKENRTDDLNIELTLTIAKDDYADRKKKRLNDYRRKADIKGFRRGMVPMSLVERIYGQSALVDSVNDAISETLNGYINEHKLHVMGEPLPSEDQPQVEWKDGNDFTFTFDIALTPEVKLELSKEDEILYYNITVKDEAKKEMKDNLLRQYGSLEDGDAAGEDDFLIADFEQGDMKIEGTYVALRNVDESVRSSFVGLKPGDSIDVDVNRAFTNETDRASLLKVKKEELAGIQPVFRMTVKTVKTFKPAELNQDTFDRIFGEGAVKSEEEFDKKIADRLAAEYAQESEFRFSKDAKDYLIKKAGISLPEKFLKRWITVTNEGKFTQEEIDREFPSFLNDFRWQMIRGFLAEKYAVKVEDADMFSAAKSFAAYQFAMYGLANVPDEQLETYAKSVLANDKERGRIYDQVEEQKVLNAVRADVTLKNKKISVEKFRELK